MLSRLAPALKLSSRRFIAASPILFKHNDVEIIHSDAAPEYKLGLPRYIYSPLLFIDYKPLLYKGIYFIFRYLLMLILFILPVFTVLTRMAC